MRVNWVECSVSESTKSRMLVQRDIDSLAMCDKSRRPCVDTVLHSASAVESGKRGHAIPPTQGRKNIQLCMGSFYQV